MFWKNRYTAITIVFMVWLLSYMDRMVMATAIPYIAKEFNLSPMAMGVVLSSFFAGYFICQIPGGILADKFGARKVMAGAVLWWSVFTAVTGAVGSLATMLWVRFVFGIGEGIAPAATWKALANWTPMKDRGMANGLMMASNALGPALAPLFVVAIMQAWGWRTVFYSLLIPGVLLALWIWFSLPDRPADKKGITQAELDELQENKAELGTANTAANMSFWHVISESAVYKSFLILFFSNITAWGFISWLPSYLVKARGFELAKLGFAASIPMFAGTVGFVVGGWLIDKPFKENKKIPLIVSQVITAVFLYLTYTVQSIDMLIVYQTCAGFFLMTATGVIFGLPMSAISKEIAGRAMGIVNTGGQLAGFLSPIIVGYLVQSSGAAGTNFDTAFQFFIASTLCSAIVGLTFKQRKAEDSLSA